VRRKMKIKDGGKEHREGDPHCKACDAPQGERHPQLCGVKLCTGLLHAEGFPDSGKEGPEFAYRCDKCGGTVRYLLGHKRFA
jgi:hypothetical protein